MLKYLEGRTVEEADAIMSTWHELTSVDWNNCLATCSICGEGTPIIKKGKNRICRNKNREIGREWKKNHLEQSRAYNRDYMKRRREETPTIPKYGPLSKDEYNARLDQQNGVCAICFQTDSTSRLYVDHDHSTGEVRGLLCRGCNWGLGHFRDTPEFLESASLYIRKSRSTA